MKRVSERCLVFSYNLLVLSNLFVVINRTQSICSDLLLIDSQFLQLDNAIGQYDGKQLRQA